MNGRALAEPNVEFSRWVAWRDRASLQLGTPCLGVYLWGRFEEPSDAHIDAYPVLPRQLVYVGESNDIEARPLGGRAHEHIAKYVVAFPDDAGLERLYVSICRVARFKPRDPHCHSLRAFTRFLEARIGWEYTRQFGRRPRLDYKTGKDEFVFQGAPSTLPG
jgi:hypothetical protein